MLNLFDKLEKRKNRTMNMKDCNRQTRYKERGNVLFLILVAVALFAALSYAVTQSTRGGGKSATDESDLISTAQITQYPSTVKTAVVRMRIDGVAETALEFNPPADYASCTSNTVCVFHPEGGGATYAQVQSALMADGNPGTWHFNREFEIVNVGISSGTSADGNEILALLPGIHSTLCARINEKLGITGDVTTAATFAAEYVKDMDDAYAIPATEKIIGDANTAGLAGQPFGCFIDSGGDSVYYHAIVEN